MRPACDATTTTELGFAYGQPQNSNDLKISNAFGDASSALAARQRRYRSCIDFFTQGRSLEEISKIFQNFWKTAESFPSSAKAVAGTLSSGDRCDGPAGHGQ